MSIQFTCSIVYFNSIQFTHLQYSLIQFNSSLMSIN
uniref:Uncharacterized protein n=1 Tax=Arundo donax TaxID=35708 RepID=A0A0A9BSU8_ARUDO